MDTGEAFINAFRQLESDMRESLPEKDRGRDFNGMLNLLAQQDPYFRQQWSELDLCRQLRNILSHFPRMEGESPLTPNPALTKLMEEAAQHLRHPEKAMDLARTSLYTVTEESSLRDTLREMRRRGFSHVPVLRGRCLVGVFSVGTVFTAVCRDHEITGQDRRIGDFLPDIALDAHENEQYVLVSAQEPLERIRELFLRPGDSRRKVAAVFITKNGRSEEPLLGMITPWDVLKATEE